MKRNKKTTSSDSELDENIEVEKDSADENAYLCSSHGLMSPSGTTKVQARKRRRGIIEKRRRDRINSSLSELRRLVPTACEKQGSAKLEKAEILQMTVDHLKMLHAANSKGYFDAPALAVDYHSLGFQECLAETARYLSIVEGRDDKDPLQARLLSHLSSYASRREVHPGPGHPAWGSPAAHDLLRQGQGQPAAAWRARSPSSSLEAAGKGRLVSASLPGRLRELLNSSLSLGPPGSSAKLSPPLLSSWSTFPLSFTAFPLVCPPALSVPASSAAPERCWGTEIGAF